MGINSSRERTGRPFIFPRRRRTRRDTNTATTSQPHAEQPTDVELPEISEVDLNMPPPSQNPPEIPSEVTGDSPPSAPSEETPNTGPSSRLRLQPLYIISYVQRGSEGESTDERRPPRRLLLFVFGGRDDEEESFQSLLNRLLQMYEPQGPPPASPKAVEALPEIIVSHSIKEEHIKCTVCFEDFEIGNIGVKLPCGHLFDKPCLEPWLKQHNTCPVCRYELPVEDPEYEKQRVERMASRGFSQDSLEPRRNNEESNSLETSEQVQPDPMDSVQDPVNTVNSFLPEAPQDSLDSEDSNRNPRKRRRRSSGLDSKRARL